MFIFHLQNQKYYRPLQNLNLDKEGLMSLRMGDDLPPPGSRGGQMILQHQLNQQMKHLEIWQELLMNHKV